MIAYIEHYNRDQNVVLFDFVDSNDFFLFHSESNLGQQDFKRSMILLKNYSGKSLNIGSYYFFKENVLLDNLALESRILEVDESYIIDIEMTLKSSHDQIFEGTKSYSRWEIFQRNLEVSTFDSLESLEKIHRPEKVIIKYVGQGSWNEIYDKNEISIIFDFGASYQYPKKEIDELAKVPNQNYPNFNPTFLLSHWDVDHYHCIKALTDESIKSFKYFIFRNRLPNLTSRTIYGRIKALNHNCLIGIEPLDKLQKGMKDRLIPILNTDHIIIYNSRKIRSRNRNALTLSVRSANKSVVFPGDCHYEEINDCMLPHLAYNHSNNLVVPHHGGKAGKVVYSNLEKDWLNHAIISVGKNNYGHPLESVKNSLKEIGFKKVNQMNLEAKDVEIEF